MDLNVEAITSQKTALGFVENPACWKLRELAQQVPADQAIVEIGAYKGRSTGWLALGSSEGNSAPVFSIDTWETRPRSSWPANSPKYVDAYALTETRKAYEDHLDLAGIRSLVTPLVGYATNIAASWDGPKVGLLFHDAEHTREAVRDDLRAWLPHLADGAVIICHDVGNPAFGVEAGAKDALGRRKAWNWAGREIDLWPKQPTRRGTLVVRSK